MTLPRCDLGRGVVRLAELHDVDAVLAERGTDRRGGVGLPGLDLQLDQPGDFFFFGAMVLLFLSRFGASCALASRARIARSWRPG